ncbi:MarC family protein [Pseudoroseomonas cervicalis]|uniref:MarC family protein n=1 Tax=Teichococcus cervicalis TaxID=204525 RepID=UPI00278923C4|nr:MarC family protein [Pseudoroseomonas cervicalis]MDQ1081992.1 multiple antibiotic resistance protein [Pseudoroseomonas cervicalis]
MLSDITPLGSVAGAFLLAFPALFSIVNPLGAALIFSQVMSDRSAAERAYLARRVGLYSLLVLLGALWGGASILNFFGISLGALRVAGGLVVAIRAWSLLMAPEEHESRKEQQAAPASDAEAVAFFPLTMPFTTGPGSIAVAITLSAAQPIDGTGLWAFFAGVSAAAAVTALTVWIAYNWADRLIALLGRNGTRVVMRMAAFLLLCIGVQILSAGVQDLLVAALAAAGTRG